MCRFTTLDEMESLPQEVTTPRLTLRRWQPTDAHGMHDAVQASIEHLRPWMAWIAFEPLTVEARRDLIIGWGKEQDAGGDGVLGVFLDETPIGGCGLHRRRGPGALEIGYWIHADHTGNGYATELARGLTSAALAIDTIDRVEIHHDKANHISGRVPRRLGYRLTAEVADEIVAPAETGVSCIWQVTGAEWASVADD